MCIFASLEVMRKAHPDSTTLFFSLDLNLTPYPSLIPGVPSALAFDLTPSSPCSYSALLTSAAVYSVANT